MKTNEAPERLYLSKNIYSTFVYQTPDPDDETQVEYIRRDFVNSILEMSLHPFKSKKDIKREILIDKAWDWIEDNLLTSNQQDKSRLYFEQFRRHMKGE